MELLVRLGRARRADERAARDGGPARRPAGAAPPRRRRPHARPALARGSARGAPSGDPAVPRGRAGRAAAAGDRWERDDPLLYVSFGSVAAGAGFYPGLYRGVVDALEGLPARVLITVGTEVDPADLGALPAHVHVERWVPQAAVMPHAAAMIGHGGSGSTLMAMAAGVPVALIPHVRRPARQRPPDRGARRRPRARAGGGRRAGHARSPARTRGRGARATCATRSSASSTSPSIRDTAQALAAEIGAHAPDRHGAARCSPTSPAATPSPPSAAQAVSSQ